MHREQNGQSESRNVRNGARVPRSSFPWMGNQENSTWTCPCSDIFLFQIKAAHIRVVETPQSNTYSLTSAGVALVLGGWSGLSAAFGLSRE